MSGNDCVPLLTHTVPGYNGHTNNLVLLFLLPPYMSLRDNTMINHRTKSFQAEIVKGRQSGSLVLYFIARIPVKRPYLIIHKMLKELV